MLDYAAGVMMGVRHFAMPTRSASFSPIILLPRSEFKNGSHYVYGRLRFRRRAPDGAFHFRRRYAAACDADEEKMLLDG